MGETIDGKAMAAELRAELRADVAKYVQQQGQTPEVVVVRVGGDTASGVYSKAILRAAENVGLTARLEQLPTRTSGEELQELLQQLNASTQTRGVIVQMPLPGHLSQQMVAEVEIGANYQVRIVKLAGYQSAVVPPLKPSLWPGQAHTRQSPGHARYVAHLHERGPFCPL